MTILEQYGWNQFHSKNFETLKKDNLFPGRITSVKGFKYHLITEKGELETELSGKLLYGANPDELPQAGDWVAFLDYGDMGYIVDVLPRFNALARKNPGKSTEKQILAANIDVAFIVQGLDRDFNLMKLERYITQIIACDITPVVLLNKADLLSDKDMIEQQILSLKRDLAVFFCSVKNNFGMSEIMSFMQPCQTYILIGSSGVGKSSLLNLLAGREVQKTSSVSDANLKGRHTTTTRDLEQLPNGSLLIDSPGMREFGMTGTDQSSDEMFPAIEALAGDCRYKDCKHLNEAGCAVLEALETEELGQVVYASYVKLMKEQRRFEINAEDKKRTERQFGKMTKEAKEHRKKYKN